jgi:hypothetical protein
MAVLSLLSRIVWYKFTDVSEVPAASIVTMMSDDLHHQGDGTSP